MLFLINAGGILKNHHWLQKNRSLQLYIMTAITQMADCGQWKMMIVVIS